MRGRVLGCAVIAYLRCQARHGHGLNRLGPENARAIKTAAAAQHFAETPIVVGCGDQTGTARKQRHARWWRKQPRRHGSHLLLLDVPQMTARHARRFVIGQVEEGVVHSKRVKNARLKKLLEGLSA